jgi:hypothetical protein
VIKIPTESGLQKDKKNSHGKVIIGSFSRIVNSFFCFFWGEMTMPAVALGMNFYRIEARRDPANLCVQGVSY